VAAIMRRILVDHSRSRGRDKRGGSVRRVPLEHVPEPSGPVTPDSGVDVEALDRALDKLGALDPRQARIVELRYFSGMTIEEIAEALAVSPGTVKRDWTVARAWLFSELAPAPAAGG
jgi:RNA polymerase sigma factor (TIGR02999 family)